MSAPRCAFAAIRRFTHESRSWDVIDYLTIAESPDAARVKADRLGDDYTGPVIRVAAVVIREERLPHHDAMEAAHRRIHGPANVERVRER